MSMSAVFVLDIKGKVRAPKFPDGAVTFAWLFLNRNSLAEKD